MLRYLTGGESHGLGLTMIAEGFPAGLPVPIEELERQLARRRKGYGRGSRMKIERDQLQITGGVRGGLSLGSPLVIYIQNQEWEKWRPIMAPGQEADLELGQMSIPRPGHADLAGAWKYNQQDLRNIWERASARETAARVAAGTLARLLLAELGIKIYSWVKAVGGIYAAEPDWNQSETYLKLVEDSELSCPDPSAEAKMRQKIDQAKQQGDSLGGIWEVRVENLVPGLGSYVQADRRLDGRLAAAVMSIPSIKGVEIGLGWEGADLKGSQVQDAIFYDQQKGFHHSSNRAGGLEGGITNGEPLVVRAAVKPIPTLTQPLASVDLRDKQPAPALAPRSDTCVVPAAAVIGEAAVAWELAGAVLEKFGGDTLAELKRNWLSYQQQIQDF